MSFKEPALKDIIVATQADLRDNPEHANATFAADSRQIDGLRSETKIRQFSLTVDEPPNLGGTDTGPNPVLSLPRSPPARRSPTALTPPRSAFRSRAFR
jgi:hypothetical protein